jgi:hypothetical protein
MLVSAMLVSAMVVTQALLTMLDHQTPTCKGGGMRRVGAAWQPLRGWHTCWRVLQCGDNSNVTHKPRVQKNKPNIWRYHGRECVIAGVDVCTCGHAGEWACANIGECTWLTCACTEARALVYEVRG